MSAAQLVKQLAWRLYRVDENSKATDVGLLLIRVTFCLCLFYHHGAEKFYDFHTLVHHPLDPVGIGVVPSVLFAGAPHIPKVCPEQRPHARVGPGDSMGSKDRGKAKWK